MNPREIAMLSPAELAELRLSIKSGFEALWVQGGAAVGILNRRYPGLVVPEHLRDGEGPLVLAYDAEPVIPIDDLELTEAGISATLSFGRSPYKTFVPWEAVDGLGPTRPVDDAQAPARPRPRLFLAAQEPSRGVEEALDDRDPPARPRPRLSLVPSNPAPETSDMGVEDALDEIDADVLTDAGVGLDDDQRAQLRTILSEEGTPDSADDCVAMVMGEEDGEGASVPERLRLRFPRLHAWLEELLS